MPRRNRTHQARRKRTTARLYAVVNEPTPDWGGGSSANPPTSCDDTATAKTPPPIATDVPAPPPTPRPTPTPPGTRRGRSRSGSPTQSPPLQPLSAEHLLALVTAALGEIPVLPVHLDHAAHADADLIEYRRCNKTGRDKARRFLVQAGAERRRTLPPTTGTEPRVLVLIERAVVANRIPLGNRPDLR